MRGAFRSLRHRDFRLYFWGELVSMTGTWMQFMAQGWLVYRLTGSTVLLGLIMLASHAPFMLLGMVGGAAADRFERRKIQICAQSLAAAQALVLGALTYSGRVETWHVFALASVLGVANAFELPSRQAFLSDVVPREDLGNAIAINTIVFNASRLVGPAAAGLVVARWGEGAAFLANAASFLASIWALCVIKTLRPVSERAPGVRPSALAEARAGVRYAFGHPAMRAMLVLLAVISFAGVPYVALMPVFAKDVLQGGPEAAGWLMAASGLGAVGASFGLAARSSVEGLPRLTAVSAAAFGASLVVFAFSKGMALSLVALAFAGWGMMTSFTACNTLLQSLTTDEMRGRVMSLFSMTFMAFNPLGSAVSGTLAARIGAPVTVALGAVACVAAGAAFARLAERHFSAAGSV